MRKSQLAFCFVVLLLLLLTYPKDVLDVVVNLLVVVSQLIQVGVPVQSDGRGAVATIL